MPSYLISLSFLILLWRGKGRGELRSAPFPPTPPPPHCAATRPSALFIFPVARSPLPPRLTAAAACDPASDETDRHRPLPPPPPILFSRRRHSTAVRQPSAAASVVCAASATRRCCTRSTDRRRRRRSFRIDRQTAGPRRLAAASASAAAASAAAASRCLAFWIRPRRDSTMSRAMRR